MSRLLMPGIASQQIFTPARLFSSGEQGAWYEPKPEYLFQDAAGTAPVTADGDPVGLRLDLSGNGNHQTAPASANRPLYRTDGVRHWLEPDGVDDTLVSVNKVPWLTSSTAVAFAFSRFRNTSGQAYYVHADGTQSTQKDQSFSVLLDTSGEDRQRIGGELLSVPVVIGADRYLMVQFDKSEGEGLFQWDSQSDEQAFTPGEASRTDAPLRSYSRGPNDVNFKGRDYGFLAVAQQIGVKDRQRVKDYMEAL